MLNSSGNGYSAMEMSPLLSPGTMRNLLTPDAGRERQFSPGSNGFSPMQISPNQPIDLGTLRPTSPRAPRRQLFPAEPVRTGPTLNPPPFGQAPEVPAPAFTTTTRPQSPPSQLLSETRKQFAQPVQKLFTQQQSIRQPSAQLSLVPERRASGRLAAKRGDTKQVTSTVMNQGPSLGCGSSLGLNLGSGYNPNIFFATYDIDINAPGFVGNIEQLTLENLSFRTVLHTTPKSQIVVMSLNAHEDIGWETHANNDQFIRIEKGSGTIVMDGVSRAYGDGTAITIPSGTKHNVIARTETKLYTVYSPAHHKYDVIDVTKADAIIRERETSLPRPGF